LPDATRWAGDWWDAPENAEAKRDASQALFELKQAWIYRQTDGREPSIELQRAADDRFPADIGMFKSRPEMELFIKNEQRELQQEIEREQAAIFNAGQGGAGSLYRNPMAGGSGNTIGSGKKVFPDG